MTDTTSKPYRVITLPNGRQCGLRVYANAWRTLKSLPPERLCPGFDYFPERADYILRRMVEGLHDRINIRGNTLPLKPRLHGQALGIVGTHRFRLYPDIYRSANRHQKRRIRQRLGMGDHHPVDVRDWL